MKKVIILLMFVLSFLLIQFGFVKLEEQVEKYNNTQVEIHVEDGVSSHNDIALTIDISQQWTDYDTSKNKLIGAQYDVTIANHGKHIFRDWKVVLYMPLEGRVDNLWNGEYTQDGDVLTVTPLDYNTVVEEEDNQPFGFVCISKNVLRFTSMKVYGYFKMDMKDTDAYKILQTIRIIWLIALICYIIVEVCLISYRRRHKRDQKIIQQTMDTFTSFIDAKDPYTLGHSVRVAIYTRELASRMGLSKEEVENYYYTGLLHDCGKLAVPDTILKKPEALTKEERKVIESHTLIGGEILKNFTVIPGIRNGALQHHERYDGTGYPNQLKGNTISLVGRILCVADAYDAMNSDRCYRKKLSMEKIKSELNENAGTQFDPEVVAHMLDIINEGLADKLVQAINAE